MASGIQMMKDFNMGNRLSLISKQGGTINFGGSYVFSAAQKSGFKGYTLDAILYLLVNRGLSIQEYLKQANVNKVSTISMIDRKPLLEFLDGKGELHLEAVEGAFSTEAPAAKRARTEEEEGEIEGIESLSRQERQLRNRNTMLVAPNKSFHKVLEIVSKAMQSYRPGAAPSHAPSTSKQQQPKVQARGMAVPIKPSGRFDREVTTDQIKAMAGEAGANLASGLQLYGAYNSSTAPAQQQKPPPPPSQQTGSRPPSGVSAKPSAPPPSSSGSRHTSSRGAPKPAQDKGQGSKSASQPIIIVPSGLTAMINMYNAKAFLESGRFESSEAVQLRPEFIKHSTEAFDRTAGKAPGTPPVQYIVTDKAPPKDHPDWKRVVAVIVSGAKWQFKDWPFKGTAEGDLSMVFTQICGFFLNFSSEKVPEAVANWNVKRLSLHPDNRHLDMTVLLEIFRHLDAFLASKKCTLIY